MNKRDIIFLVFVLGIFFSLAFASSAGYPTRCEDSDGGSIRETAGIAEYITPDGTNTYHDTCASNTLKEYYCSSPTSVPSYESISCSDYGEICSNGACVEDPDAAPTITNYGTDYVNSTGVAALFIKTNPGSYCKYGTTSTFYWDSGKLFNPSNVAHSEHYKVLSGFSQGQTYTYYAKCRPQLLSGTITSPVSITFTIPRGIGNNCADTDGGQYDYITKGTVTGTYNGQDYSETDYCLTSINYVVEHYCFNGNWKDTFHYCGTGYTCPTFFTGACVPIGGGETSTPNITSSGTQGSITPTTAKIYATTDIVSTCKYAINPTGYPSYDQMQYFMDGINALTHTKNLDPLIPNKYYRYVIRCKADLVSNATDITFTTPNTGSGGITPILSTLNGKWVDKNNANPEIFEKNFTEGQLGTSVSKVGIKITKINSGVSTKTKNTINAKAIDTVSSGPSIPVVIDIYELDTIPLQNILTTRYVSNNSNIFLSLMGRAIKTNILTYTTIDVPVYIKTINATMTNNEAIVYWTITKEDILKSGSEESYDFYFKARVGIEEKVFNNKLLNVHIDWGNVGNITNSSVVKKWLDKDKKTVITQKTIPWEDLTPFGGNEHISSGSPLTGNIVAGNNLLLLGANRSSNKNLLYMNASNLGVAPETVVYFSVYEKDSHEGGGDDSIRTGIKAIPVSANSDQSAVAPIFFSQEDIRAAISQDEIEINGDEGKIVFEFYYELSTLYNSPVPTLQTGILYLTVTFNATSLVPLCGNGICDENEDATTCPEDCNSSSLANVTGLWKNKDMTEELIEADYNYDEENIAVAFVSGIDSSMNGKEILFRIWEDDGLGGEGIDTTSTSITRNTVDTNYNENIISLYQKTLIRNVTANVDSGEAFYIWEITDDDLDLAGYEEDERYEFYFDIILGETSSKTFKDKIFKLNIGDSNSPNGTSDECDEIYYCVEHLTEEMCNNPCLGTLENEIELNSEVNCSNESIYCTCAWVDDKCSFAYSSKENIFGSCVYIAKDIIENCYNTGTLIMTYDATWIWSENNCYETKSECEETIEGWGIQCLNRDGCWRQTDSEYNMCKDYQETKDCSPSGSVDPVEPGIKTKKDWYTQLWFLTLIAIVIVFLILFILWFLLSKRKKGDKEKILFKNKNNFYNIMNYINNVKRKNMPDLEVKDNLKKAGWAPEQIKYAMNKYSGERKARIFRIFHKK